MAGISDDVRRWIDAGLIDEGTARRILDFEKAREAQAPPSGRPGVPEILVYLAAAITAAGIVVLAATNWEHLSTFGRIAIPAVSAVVVLAAGYMLRRTDNEAMIRGASLAWLLAGGLACATAAIASSEADWSEENVALAAGVTALVAAVGLWAWMPMHAQLVGIGGAAFLFSMGLSSRASEDWIMGSLGVMLALFGAIGVAAIESGVLFPRSTARVGAAFGLCAGAFFAGMPPTPSGGELLAVVAVVVLIGAGIRFQSLVYVGFGVLTAFVALLQLILRHIDSPTIAGLALIAAGLLLLLAIAGLREARPWERWGKASNAAGRGQTA